MKRLSRPFLTSMMALLVLLSGCDEKSVSPGLKSSEKAVVVVYGKASANNNSSRIAGNIRNAWVNRDSQGNLIGWLANQSIDPQYNTWVLGMTQFGTNPVGTGFNFSNYFNTDWDGDSFNDLICRDSNGTLFFFPFDGNSLTYSGGNVVGNSFYFTDYMAADWNGDRK